MSEPIYELLTPGAAARMLGVDPKTLNRWATAKRVPSQRTLGGHRRFRREDIEALINRGYQPAEDFEGENLS